RWRERLPARGGAGAGVAPGRRRGGGAAVAGRGEGCQAGRLRHPEAGRRGRRGHVEAARAAAAGTVRASAPGLGDRGDPAVGDEQGRPEAAGGPGGPAGRGSGVRAGLAERILAPVITGRVLLAVFQLVASAGLISPSFSSPAAIALAGARAVITVEFWSALGVTLSAWLIAVVIAVLLGAVLGVIIGSVPVL